MKTLNQKGRYIDYNKIFGYNRMIYMIMCDRGFGKTHGATKHLISDYFKNGNKFIYLRRYKDEMKHIDTFFEEANEIFPDHDFKIKGWNFYIDGKLAGRGMVLTRHQSYKGGNFIGFNNIIFDEFLREQVGSVGYIKGEVNAFLSICDTVFRDRENVKVLMLGNSITEINPYFLDFGIIRKNNSEYAFSNKPLIKDKIIAYIRDVDEETEKQNIQRSGFRSFFGAVDSYKKMSINNEFSDDMKIFIDKKSQEAKYYCTLKVGHDTKLGVWIDTINVKIFISRKFDPKCKTVFTFDKLYHDENTKIVLNYRDEYKMTRITNAFKNRKLFFETSEAKQLSFELFSKIKIF